MSTDIIYIPYTYLIGWSKLNWWYYGCEYGCIRKTANPSNLWATYFTSSKHVAIIRDTYGEPDVIQIRKIFIDEEKCRRWEKKVLKRMNVIKDSKWINKHNTLSIATYGEKNGFYGKGEQVTGNKNHFYGKKHSKKTLKQQRNKKLGKTQTPETVAKKLQTFITNGKTKKEYIVTNPFGFSWKIRGLSSFCKDNKLSAGIMCMVSQGKRNHHHHWLIGAA